MSESNERSVPYYCPYCGGEDLRPSEASRGEPTASEHRSDRQRAGSGASAEASRETLGAWECRECTRVFSVKLIGLVVSR